MSDGSQITPGSDLSCSFTVRWTLFHCTTCETMTPYRLHSSSTSSASTENMSTFTRRSDVCEIPFPSGEEVIDMSAVPRQTPSSVCPGDVKLRVKECSWKKERAFCGLHNDVHTPVCHTPCLSFFFSFFLSPFLSHFSSSTTGVLLLTKTITIKLKRSCSCKWSWNKI